MPPEQVRGESADARSDIYSFGASLYEMLTGKLPFDTDSQYALMTAQLNTDPPPPITLRSDLPPALNQIIMMCMAKDPDDVSSPPTPSAPRSKPIPVSRCPRHTPPPSPIQRPIANSRQCRRNSGPAAALSSEPTLIDAPATARTRAHVADSNSDASASRRSAAHLGRATNRRRSASRSAAAASQAPRTAASGSPSAPSSASASCSAPASTSRATWARMPSPQRSTDSPSAPSAPCEPLFILRSSTPASPSDPPPAQRHPISSDARLHPGPRRRRLRRRQRQRGCQSAGV